MTPEKIEPPYHPSTILEVSVTKRYVFARTAWRTISEVFHDHKRRGGIRVVVICTRSAAHPRRAFYYVKSPLSPQVADWAGEFVRAVGNYVSGAGIEPEMVAIYGRTQM